MIESLVSIDFFCFGVAVGWGVLGRGTSAAAAIENETSKNKANIDFFI
jgi:hypothetical protein